MQQYWVFFFPRTAWTRTCIAAESLADLRMQVPGGAASLVHPAGAWTYFLGTTSEANATHLARPWVRPLIVTNWPKSLRFGIMQNLSGPVLRDTARLSQRYPPIARYGVFGVSTWPIRCDTLSPFSERFPLGEHAKWRCDNPPLKRGISAIIARYPRKTRQMGAIPPSAILSRFDERVLRDVGGYLALGR